MMISSSDCEMDKKQRTKGRRCLKQSTLKLCCWKGFRKITLEARKVKGMKGSSYCCKPHSSISCPVISCALTFRLQTEKQAGRWKTNKSPWSKPTPVWKIMKTLKHQRKKTGKDTRRWKDFLGSLIGRINTEKIAILSKAISESRGSSSWKHKIH